MKRLVLVLAILLSACSARGPLGGTFTYTPPGWVGDLPIVGPAITAPVEPAPAPAPVPAAVPVQPAPTPVLPPAIVR